MNERTITRLSLHGRIVDELGRDALPGRILDVVLPATGQRALLKEDGHFVFLDLEPSASAYEVAVGAPSYRRRTLTAHLPTSAAVEIAPPGEDELFVVLSGVDGSQDRVSFGRLPFVPTIRAGAAVFGPGDFSATLTRPLEGSEVDFAILSSVTGLAAGDLLRFVRSRNLVLQPGPSYPFDTGTTLVAFKVVENTAGEPPLAGVAIRIDQVDGIALTTTTIGGVELHSVTLPGPSTLLLGPDRAVHASTDQRGAAVFYLPGDTPVTTLRMRIAKTGYATTTATITLTAGERTFRAISLDRV